MGSVILCGSEGDYAAFENTLDVFGADTQRDGSVKLLRGDEMFLEWTEAASNITWIHVRFAMADNVGATFSANDIIVGRTATTNNLFRISPVNESNAGQTNVSVYLADTPTTEVLWGETFIWGPDTWVNLDLKIQISTTTLTDDTITYTFFRDGVQRFKKVYVAGSAFTSPAQMLLACKSTSATGANGENTFFQDVIVTDDVPTPSMELVTMRPNAAGTYADFTNDYTAIDEQGYDPTDAITADTVSDKESWTFSTPGYSLGDRLIYGVAMSHVTQLDLNDVIADFRPFVRISGTDYDGVGLNSEKESANAGIYVWTQNPDTAQDWTTAVVNALESGVEAI